MRKELIEVAKIEAYVNGTMSPEDKVRFESMMDSDSSLKQKVEAHQDIVKAINRQAIRAEIKKASGSGSGWMFTVGSIILLLSVGIFFFYQSQKTNEMSHVESTLEEVELLYEEDTPCDGLKTFVDPDVQSFIVKAEEGAILEGEQGTVVVVPECAFVDSNGNCIDGNVQVDLVEALTLEDMILYNLTTQSDSAALQTDGMFYLKSTLNGQEVRINPERPFYIEIPTDEVKEGMLLFDGEVTEEGNINWKNPKPLQSYLTQVDFSELKFRPEGFDEMVDLELPFQNIEKGNESVYDSLYYSLERCVGDVEGTRIEFTPQLNQVQAIDDHVEVMEPQEEAEEISELLRRHYVSPDQDGSVSIVSDSITLADKLARVEAVSCAHCGIDPLTIKTIRTSRFAKTFLSTREMEERIKLFHKASNGDQLLQLYIGNLSKNLSDVDRMAMKMASGKLKVQLEKWANLNYTNIKDAEIYQEKLSAYFVAKRKQNKAVRETLSKELAKKQRDELKLLQKGLNRAINEKRMVDVQLQQQNRMLAVLKVDSIKAPYNVPAKRNRKKVSSNSRSGNTVSVVQVQIGNRFINTANSQRYGFSWASAGWGNIDAYLHLVNKDPVIVEFKGVEGQQRVFQYLNTIDNITGINNDQGVRRSLFPNRKHISSKRMERTYAFGIEKKESMLSWSQAKFNPYQVSEVEMSWETLNEEDVRLRLRALGQRPEKVLGELERQVRRQLKLEAERRKAREEKEIAVKAMRVDISREMEAVRDQIKKTESNQQKAQEKINAKQKEIQAKWEEIHLHNRFVAKMMSFVFPCWNIGVDEEGSQVQNTKEELKSIEKNVPIITSSNQTGGWSGSVSLEPSFKGGDGALQKYLRDQLVYPEEAIRQGVQGKVFVRFGVRTDGSLFNVRATNGHKLLIEEAVRVVSEMPRWNPAVSGGAPLVSEYTLPIKFRL